MKCIWCRKREATREAFDVGFCQECFNILGEWDKVCVARSFEGKCWQLGKAVEELKQALKASLPRWLRWVI